MDAPVRWRPVAAYPQFCMDVFGVVVLQPRLCGRAVGAVGSTSACEFGWWIAYGDAALFISNRGDSSELAQCTAFVHAVVASHINWSHFFLSGIKLRQLQTFGDMLAHIGEPNVYWRLILLFGIILPSALLLHVIPYNWMKSRVRLRWIRHYTYTILLISALYAVFMLTRSASVSVVHLFVCLTLAMIVTYEELFARFCIPSDCPTELPVEPVKSSSPSEEEENPLVIRLNHLLEEEKVWKNPDLTVASLAQMLGTNRSYLAQAIQEAGYVNFADLINRHRVQAFCCIAEDGKVKSVQDAFFLVGFRSKETALRSFKKYTGSLPSEYLMKVAANRSKTSEL